PDKLKIIKKNKIYPRFIDNLSNKIDLLIENEKLRERMGKEGFKQVSQGKFSIKERNKKLRRIYEEALK
ncbi:MAG: hypothetical protein K6T16_02520, partial [Candidatus Pacearchaeota archaeon]|nr:hypothetical protein [Candidatus Pacearchaeota archaeon]